MGTAASDDLLPVKPNRRQRRRHLQRGATAAAADGQADGDLTQSSGCNPPPARQLSSLQRERVRRRAMRLVCSEPWYVAALNLIFEGKLPYSDDVDRALIRAGFYPPGPGDFTGPSAVARSARMRRCPHEVRHRKSIRRYPGYYVRDPGLRGKHAGSQCEDCIAAAWEEHLGRLRAAEGYVPKVDASDPGAEQDVAPEALAHGTSVSAVAIRRLEHSGTMLEQSDLPTEDEDALRQEIADYVTQYGTTGGPGTLPGDAAR